MGSGLKIDGTIFVGKKGGLQGEHYKKKKREGGSSRMQVEGNLSNKGFFKGWSPGRDQTQKTGGLRNRKRVTGFTKETWLGRVGGEAFTLGGEGIRQKPVKKVQNKGVGGNVGGKKNGVCLEQRRKKGGSGVNRVQIRPLEGGKQRWG